MLAVQHQPYVASDPTGFCLRLIDLQLNPQGQGIDDAALADRLAAVARVDSGRHGVVPWQAKLETDRNIDRHWNVTYSSHGWHRYVGRFPPHLVRALLNHFGLRANSVVLDPFAGSGTTLVESRMLGIESIGIEICPLSYLMSSVKARLDLPPDDLAHARDVVLNRFLELRARPDRVDLEVMPSFPNINRWFSEEVRIDLCALLQALVEFGDCPARDAILVALSASMRSIGNIDVDVVRAEYRRIPRSNVNLDGLVSRKIARMINDLRTFQQMGVPVAKARVHLGDARHTDRLAAKADFIVTSPPYGIESISYLRTHMLSYRALHHFLKSDPWTFGETVIGSEYLEKKLDSNVDELQSPTAHSFFRRFRGETGPSLRRVEQSAAYFRDMQKVISSWRDVLRDGIGGVMMIGNKKLLGHTIPTNVIMAELFEANGFCVEPLFEQKLICNNTNARTPWSERAIGEEHVVAFFR